MISSTADLSTLQRREFFSAGAVAIAATAFGGGSWRLTEEHPPRAVRPQ